MWDGGFTEYIHDWWNLMDFAMNSLYLATISLKIVAYVKVNWNFYNFSYAITLVMLINFSTGRIKSLEEK
jgi:hypothetical protein